VLSAAFKESSDDRMKQQREMHEASLQMAAANTIKVCNSYASGKLMGQFGTALIAQGKTPEEVADYLKRLSAAGVLPKWDFSQPSTQPPSTPAAGSCQTGAGAAAAASGMAAPGAAAAGGAAGGSDAGDDAGDDASGDAEPNGDEEDGFEDVDEAAGND
jgi:hypothetical protein